MHRIRRLSVALTVAGVVGVAAPAAASATSLVTISGATSSYPLVSLLAAKYVKLHPDKVRFKITQGGTTVGLNDVKNGSDTIADVAQEPTSADAGLDFYPIAKYAICVVTNKSNTLGNLTAEQITSIFTGKTKNWSEVSGATATGPIEVITPHVRRRRADELQVAAARRQKRRPHRHRRVHRGSDAPAGRKRPRRDRLPVELPGRQRQRQLGRGTTASRATRPPLPPGSTPAWPCSSRSPKAPPPAPPRRSSTGSTSSAAAKKIIASQWVPIG